MSEKQDELYTNKMFSAYVPHARVPYVDDYVDPKTGVVGASLTRQDMKDECDINKIMERYEKSGVWPFPPPSDNAYMDLTVLPEDYREAMNMMLDANEAFMRLPGKVRAQFDNDPAEFIGFASDPKNIEQMREWGLAPKPDPEPAPTRVEVVNPAPPAEPAAAGKPGK